MKIAQVSATFPPYLAGTGNVCYNYAKELARLGHDVTVFTSNYPFGSYNYDESINIRRFKPLFQIGNAPIMPQITKISGYDVVHLHLPFIFGDALSYLLSKIRRTRFIVTYHNDVLFSGLKGFLSEIYTNTITKSMINNSSRMIVTSKDYFNSSIINKFIKLSERRIIEIPNGVDINRFNPNICGDNIRKSYKLENSNIVLFVGALDKAHYFKGVEYLLIAFSKIESNSMYLIVIGDGDLRDYYKKLSEKLGIAERILFVGRISEDELSKYYALSDLVVLPSIARGEAFGLVLLEAMASGKPVIASNLPGVRTVIDDSVNGYLVPPKDVEELASKISFLLENKNVKFLFGQEGRRKVEKRYAWDIIGKKLEGVYEEVLDEDIANRGFLR